jgi:hypothetical protein
MKHAENIPVREAHATRSRHKSSSNRDLEWQIAIKFFRDIGNWPDDLGPPPGSSGCRAPLDLLECYGYAKADKMV